MNISCNPLMLQWRRTFETWTDMNAVLYHAPVGGAAARKFIRDHEFYYTTDSIPPPTGDTLSPAVQQAYQSAVAAANEAMTTPTPLVRTPMVPTMSTPQQAAGSMLTQRVSLPSPAELQAAAARPGMLPPLHLQQQQQPMTPDRMTARPGMIGLQTPVPAATFIPTQTTPTTPVQHQQPPQPQTPVHSTIAGIYKFDVLITSYEMVMRDPEIQQIPWRYVVIDEAHRLKCAKAKLLKTLQSMRCDSKLLLTGTPLQNNTSELWSLLNFIVPSTFNSLKSFISKFGTLSSAEQVTQLHEVLKPVMMRRMKSDVEKSLPKKEETIIDVELTTIQKKYYRAIFERNRTFLSKGTIQVIFAMI